MSEESRIKVRDVSRELVFDFSFFFNEMVSQGLSK